MTSIILTPFAFLASKWVEHHEQKILRNGVPLSAEELEDALEMGVAHPEKIRLMKVDGIPVLNGGLIRFLSHFIPRISPHTVGLSLRYGIYIHSRYWRNRLMVAHECVHTAQYERYGSPAKFLRAYFTQCIVSGYPDAELEKEAVIRSSELNESPRRTKKPLLSQGLLNSSDAQT
jgi:hypothetical protein